MGKLSGRSYHKVKGYPLEGPLEFVVKDPGGDVTFGFDGPLARDVLTLFGDGDKFRFVVTHDIMNAEVMAKVRAKGMYRGLDLANVKRFSVRYATADELGMVGKGPGVDVEQQALVFYGTPILLSTEHLRHSMRLLLAQPPIPTEWERTSLCDQLIGTGAISEEAVLGLRDIATWDNQDFAHLSGSRGVRNPLSKLFAIMSPHSGFVIYGEGKCKGVVQPGGILQPTDKQYTRHAEHLPGEIKIPTLTSEGLYAEADQDNPLGGMPHYTAQHETEITNKAFGRGVCLDFVVESGRRTKLRCRTDNMGCVNLVIPGEDRTTTILKRWNDIIGPFAEAFDFDSARIKPEKVEDIQRL